MMGSSSGSYKFGGSLSSSSNLSPLAPPFMVNKSSSTNPPMNFPELPAYGSVFDPVGSFSSAGQKFGATEPRVTASSPPSGGVYEYLGTESSNSDIYYVGRNTGYDPFLYDQFPNNIANRNDDDGDVKQYYSPYVSAPPQVNSSSYDLLSSSSSGHYSHGVSCEEKYKAKWGGSWSGLGNGEDGKWTNCAPSSGLNNFSLSNLSVNKSNNNHLFGDSISSGPFGDASRKSNVLGEVGNKSNLTQGVSATGALDSLGMASPISGNSFDIFGGTYHVGSFSIHNQGQNLPVKNLAASSSSDCSRMSCFVSGAPSIESLGRQRPILESLTPFSGSQKVNGSSSEGHHFDQKGYYMFGGSTFSAGSTLSGTQVNSASNEIASNIKPFVGYDTSYQKQPEMPLGVDFQPGIAIRRPLISYKFGSSIQRDETVNDALAPKTNDSDLHNPAEDSPCWKGSSSTRFSPFSSVSEAVVANVFVNQEDGCKIPRCEQPQTKNLPVNASDYVGFSSEKVSESTFPQKPTVHSHPKSYCIDLNIPEGLEFLDDCHVFTKDSSILTDQRSVSDSKLSSSTKKIFKDDEVSRALHNPEASVATKSRKRNPTEAHSSSGVPSEKGNDSSCLFLGEEGSNQSTKKNPESRFDVNEVLKTMMKLSQILHSNCLGNQTALTYQHLVTLRQIVNNLNAAQDSHFWKKILVPEMLNYDELEPPASKQADQDEYIRGLSKALDTFQDYNMTQGIKKILYDNLYEGIDQPEVSYKNLWLEAEAALCVMTTKARFNRVKIEMGKNSQHGMDEKENPSSPKICSDEHGPVALAPEGIDSPTLVRESQKTSTTTQSNDAGEIPVLKLQNPCLSSIKASVPKEPIKELNFPQFSYQILKSRGDDDSLVTLNNDEVKGCPNEDLSSQNTPCIDTHFSGTSNHACDVETPVMARYQILNSCVDDTETLESNDGEIFDLSRMPAKNDVDTSVMDRYQILKCRMENSGSLHDGNESPQEEDYLINRQVLNSKLLDSISSTSSVMERFRVIQNRVNSSNSARKDSPRENSSEDVNNIFGSYPNFPEDDEDVKELTVSVSAGEPLATTSYKTEIFEAWYGNDCSSSDWEHVSKEELRSKN